MEANLEKLQKSYFDVLGLCCTSEVPLVEKILKSLDGVKDYSVIVPTRTVIVVHDSIIVSQIQIVKALNQASLEANIRAYGEQSIKNKWPSPYAMACGTLLLLSFLKYFYSPLRWLAVGAIAIGIPPILLKAFSAVRNLTIDINILILIAVAGSIALRDYWEAATVVFLFTIAEWLESRASHKATAAMSALVSLVPQRAVLADTGEEMNADEVKLNTILVVKGGEIIPIDGVVVEGNCEVDEKILTGESFPISKSKDSEVWASTINLNGYITVKTTVVAEDCVVARMAKLVEEAQNKKSRTQRLLDKCAKYYTPVIVAISACLAMVPLVHNVQNKSWWYHLALVVLVNGCPCALLLSTPVAMFCALSKAARKGVLFKGAEHVETLSMIKNMAFDKTGTITRGEFSVSDVKSLQDHISLNTLLYWISSMESKSSHPMASALIDFSRAKGIEPKPEEVENFENFPGEGIFGSIGENEIYIGNSRIVSRAGCTAVQQIEGYEMEGKSVGYVLVGSLPAGIFCLSDACRTGAKEAIEELKSLGIKTVMLTGDSHAAANRTQSELHNALDLIKSQLLPEDKARFIEELQSDGPTAMVGDGVNDALALSKANVGISMGVSGSALATESGDVILMSNDIQRIPKAVRISRKVKRKIVENVIISLSTKTAVLGLAIGGYPLVWAAVLADVGTCLLVIFNSMLLLRGSNKIGNKCASHTQHDSPCFDIEAQTKCKSSSCQDKKCSSSANEQGNHKAHNSDTLAQNKCNSSSCQDKKCLSEAKKQENHKAHGSHEHKARNSHNHRAHDSHNHNAHHSHNHNAHHSHNHNAHHSPCSEIMAQSKCKSSSCKEENCSSTPREQEHYRNSHSCCEKIVLDLESAGVHNSCSENKNCVKSSQSKCCKSSSEFLGEEKHHRAHKHCTEDHKVEDIVSVDKVGHGSGKCCKH